MDGWMDGCVYGLIGVCVCVCVSMGKWMDKYVHILMDVRMNGRVYICVDGWVYICQDGYVDRWICGQIG